MSRGSPAAQQYFDARVAAASQAELHLMLLDGALRFGRQARTAWDDSARTSEVDRQLSRTTAILEELVRSVAGGKSAPSKRLEEEYAFLFRQLTHAQVHRDVRALEESIELLAYQRETWRLACQRTKSAAVASPSACDVAPRSRSPLAVSRPVGPVSDAPERLSLEA